MAKMLAAVLVAPRRIGLRRVDSPAIDRDEGPIRGSHTGVFGADIRFSKGHYVSDRLPRLAYHKFCDHGADFSLTEPDEAMAIDNVHNVRDGGALERSVSGMGANSQDALALLANGRFPTEALTRACRGFDDIQSALDDQLTGLVGPRDSNPITG